MKEILSQILRGWLIVLVLALAGTAAALAYTLVAPREYSSTAQVFVSVQQASNVQDLSQGSTFTQQVVKSYADVATTPIVLDKVISDLQLDVTAAELAEHVTATAPLDTVLVQITTQDGSAQRAAQISNAVSAQLAEVVTDLTPATDGSSPVKITRVQNAAVPSEPDNPRPLIDIPLGLFVGLFLGVVVVVLRDRLDDRVRAEHDVSGLTSTPIIGRIFQNPDAKQRPLVVQQDPTSPQAEAFRAFRTNLRFVDVDREKNLSLLITSSVAGEGKSTTSANLAITLASAGERVLLIDADLRRPKLAEYVGVDAAIGLTDVLIGSVEFTDAIQEWGGDSTLHVLPAGTTAPNPADLLQSQAMGKFLRQAEADYSVVLIDAPPLLPVTDAAVLSTQVSGVVVACAVSKVTRHQLAAALKNLGAVSAPTVGVVLTMVPMRARGRYGYATDYSYYPQNPRGTGAVD